MPLGEEWNKPAKVCMIGDSITSQASSYLANLPYPYSSMNLQGVSGNTCAQVYARRGDIPSDCQQVILQMGTNDLFGLADETDIVPKYSSFLSWFSTNRPGMRLVVMGIPPIDATQLAASYPGGVGKLTSTYINAAHLDIIDLCSSYGFAVPAMASMLGNQNGLTSDGIHAAGASYYQNLMRLAGRYRL